MGPKCCISAGQLKISSFCRSNVRISAILPLQLFEKLQNSNLEYQDEIDNLKNKVGNSKNLTGKHNNEVERMEMIITERNATINRMKTDQEKLQSAVLIRNETNLVLRGQLDELNENLILSGTLEGEKVQGLRLEQFKLQQKTTESSEIIAGLKLSLRNIENDIIQL